MTGQRTRHDLSHIFYCGLFNSIKGVTKHKRYRHSYNFLRVQLITFAYLFLLCDYPVSVYIINGSKTSTL